MTEVDWLGGVPGEVTQKWGLPGDEAAAERENVKGGNAPAERPRDEGGRFAAQEQEQEEVAQVEEQETETEEQETGSTLPPKYEGKTAEEIAQMHYELELKLGQQSAELGQLRQAVQVQRTEQPQQPPVPQPQFDVNAVLEEDPAHAAELAWRSGDQRALEYVLETWDSMSPGAKNLWIENKQNAQRLQQMEERFKTVEQPIQAQQAQQTYAQGYGIVAAQYPDFDSLQQEMGEVANEITGRTGRSFVDETLKSNDPQYIAERLEYLYLKARDRKAGNLSQVSRQLAQEHAENVREAKNEATVASSGTGEIPNPTVSTAQKIKQSWDKLSSPYEQGEGGWNV